MDIMGAYAFTLEDVIVLVSAVGAAVSVIAAWQALLVRDELGPRLKAIARRRDGLRADMIRTPGNRHRNMSASHGFMKDIVERLKLMKSSEAQKATLALAAAGIRGPDAVVTFLFMRVALPFVFGPLAWLYIYALDLLEAPWPMIVGALGALLGASAPQIYVKNLAEKRRKLVKKGLPRKITKRRYTTLKN